MTWDPTQYLAFSDHRLRPALDLLARITLILPKTVYDLGCGPGTVTKLIRRRWSDAVIVGIDSSPEMLARAAQEAPGNEWQQADIANWAPRQTGDLIYSNAALHWLDHHEELFPRLMRHLNPGGILAVQMPRNHLAPSHAEMAAVIETGPWREQLSKVRSIRAVHDAEVYFDLLSPLSDKMEIWETTYLQALSGENPVVEWTKGTALKPYLDALAADEKQEFLSAYGERMRRAYPPRANGKTLFPFKRLFIVATRA